MRRVKAAPLVQRHYHPLLVRGIGFVGRRPGLHRAVKALYRLAPGAQGYLRRFVPTPPPPAFDTPSLESKLRLVAASSMAAEGNVTLEELAFIARTL